MSRLAILTPALGLSELPRRARTGQEIVGSRQYYPGDPLKHIHWRNTARLGRPAVKEMEDTSDRAVAVVFDSWPSIGRDEETTVEYSIKIAATIGVYAIGSGDSVRLIGGRVRGDFVESEPFLHELALLEASRSTGLAALLQGAARWSPVFAIVAAADSAGIVAVEQSLHRLPGLVAVVLAGFAGGDDEIGAAERLRQAGVPVVVCTRGHLKEAISALEGIQAADVAYT